jgi:hypothetical protein
MNTFFVNKPKARMALPQEKERRKQILVHNIKYRKLKIEQNWRWNINDGEILYHKRGYYYSD